MRQVTNIRPAGAAPALDFLQGGGEMGARIRALDWSKAPMGRIESWPQSLRSPLSMMLPSKAQIILFWGPEYTVFYNDAYRSVFGAKHPHALGLPGREAWSEIWESMLHGLLEGVVRTGEAFWAKDMLFQLERFGFLEETYFDVSYDPVRDESGGVAGAYCIVTETTARVLWERRLALLKDLAARSTAARTAREACALTMEIFAAKPQDIPFALAYLDDSLQACTAGAADVFAATKPEHMKEVPIVRSGEGHTGKLVVGLNLKRPFDAEYQSFLDLVAVQVSTAVANAQAYEDERRRAEALAELDRAKTAFFSNVSHEFRTPLTLMLGPLEDALAQGGLNAADAERLDIAHRNGRRLLKLVNTLLDFSRIEAGRVQAAYRPTDVAGYTAELASVFRSACERAGLSLTVDCPPLAQPAFVDRDMWEKVVLNLLSNALKFTFDGGIAVTVRQAGEYVELKVADTGTGIPEHEMPRLFERFHRVENARARTHEGSGIGLALVQELVRLHGGSTRAESTLGKGATFTVSVPLGSAHLPAERVTHDTAATLAQPTWNPYVEEALGWLPGVAPPAAAGFSFPDTLWPAPAGAEKARRQRVLVVDDNRDMREYLARMLTDQYDVVAVADGEAALAAVRERLPELVLTDVMLPRLDGFGLLRALRADMRSAGIPIIMLSARAGEESRVEGMQAGADDYVVKPFSARELLARVAAHLQMATMRQEADRRKDEFLATLSHELRNPLAPLRNGLQLLRLKGDGASDTGPVREIMERQLNHLVRLVDDLLEMSRITRGTFELRSELVDLSTVVRNAVETSEPAIHAGGHQLDISLPAEALALEGDPVRLAQILSNLLNNAAKYTEHGGAIALTVRRDGDVALISVRDNGLGISAEGLTRIFEMFAREVRGHSSDQGGLGIGLTLSRRLAEMHGGSIEARSDGPGRGSEFVVRLPLARSAGRSQIRAKGVEPGLPLGVLVVDDNRDAAESMGMVLNALGATVELAFDGPSALEVFAASSPSVVLLDIGIPGMDGYEVARAIRARFPERRVTIIALTGWGQEEDRRRALASGIDHHMVKPADIEALRALISRVVS